MHEFSLASEVVEKLKAEKSKSTLRLKVGELLLSEDLKFWIKKLGESELPGVKIKIEKEPSLLKCRMCGYSGRGKPGEHHLIVCQKCFSSKVKVEKGKSIEVIK